LETAPPDIGADQERVMLVDVIDEAAKPDGCPGATVARLPEPIEANIMLPAEYVTQWMVPHWLGDNPLDPFDVIMFDESAT
jgi:hypothetical protein